VFVLLLEAPSPPVELNALGEWGLALAWIGLVSLNLWTWRKVLKGRPAPRTTDDG